jgi:hypothetical protein
MRPHFNAPSFFRAPPLGVMSPIKIMAGSPASASKANGVNEDMKRSNGTLVDEMKRSSGEQK